MTVASLKIAALLFATLVTAAVASIIQTQINLAAITGVGIAVTPMIRAEVTVEDLARFGPIMFGLAAAGLLPGLFIADKIGRTLTAPWRLPILTLCAVTALFVVFQVVGLFSPMPALVQATGTPAGLMAVCMSGIAGALSFALLNRRLAATSVQRQILGVFALLAGLAGLFVIMSSPGSGKVASVPAASYQVQQVASGLNRPWAIAVLPDGRRLVTERTGRLLAIAADSVTSSISLVGMTPIMKGSGAPLMFVIADREFAVNRLLYFSMGYGHAGANGTQLVRARLAGNRLDDARVLFRSTLKSSRGNNGGALAALADGTILMSVGDGDRRIDAQHLGNHFGKVIRVDRDGRPPPDNPFLNDPDARPEIYSLGHRNPQGIAVDTTSRSILLTEHGPRGGDEVNHIEAGRNYGWPLVSGGIDYSFARVTPFVKLDSYIGPQFNWTPSIAPAGLALYQGQLFAGWQGDLLVPSLKGRSLRRLVREDGRIVREESLLGELNERIRDVKTAPDGSIYVLTDGENARLLRLIPFQND